MLTLIRMPSPCGATTFSVSPLPASHDSPNFRVLQSNELDFEDVADCRAIVNSNVGHGDSYSCYYAGVSPGLAPKRVVR